jgi:hypothetical protein
VAIGVVSPSVDPELSAVTVKGAAPDAGSTLKAAIGALSGSTLTGALALAESPAESVTVTCTV